MTSSAKIDKDIAIRINSSQEMIALSNEKEYPFFNEEREYYQSDLNKKMRSYNSSFLENKATILLC